MTPVNAGGQVPDPGTMLRRRQVLGLVAGGIVAAAGGCTLRGRGRPTAEDEPAFDGEGSIRFAAPRDFSLGEQRRARVREWNKDNPTRKAVSVDLPFAADLQRADLIARLQAGRDDYDVLGLDVVWTAEFARGGYITPLDAVEGDLRLDRFLVPALDSARFDGKLWGVPLFSNAGLLYYRTDLVKRVHKTWDELAEQARELGRRHKLAGYVGQLARYEGLTVNLVEAIWGQGGDLLQADGLHLDAGATTRGLAFLRDGLDGGWIAGTARAYDEEQSRQAFQRGQALFMRNWPYAYDQLTAEDSQVRDDFGVARSRPSTPYYGQVTRAIQEAAFSVLGLGEDPASAAQRLASALPAALRGA
jgi:multiple sugar transport system substrate-binding protein